MVKHLLIIIAILLLAPCQSVFALEFDTEANKLKLYGPYIKYNVLEKPYSMGQFQFALDDIRLERGSDKGVDVVWPRFLLSFGRVRLIAKDGRVLLKEAFSEEQTGEDAKLARFQLSDDGDDLLETLGAPFQVCLSQEFNETQVQACSDDLVYQQGIFKSQFIGKNDARVNLNNEALPKNGQLTLPAKEAPFHFVMVFKSGFSVTLIDKVRVIDAKNIFINPSKKQIGIVDGQGNVRPTQLTLKDRFFTFIKEKNEFRDTFNKTTSWPEDLTDSEMEFAPFKQGASFQLYGIILTKTPPPFNFSIDADQPIATYHHHLELKGTKDESEVLAAKNRNELFIHESKRSFLWNFPTPEKGGVNRNYLSLQHKGKDYYFSKRIFRAHQTSISGSFGLSTSPTLDIVPGYNFAAEHWFEEIWGKSSWSFQRWGLARSSRR